MNTTEQMNIEAIRDHNYHVNGPLTIKIGKGQICYSERGVAIYEVAKNEVAKIIDTMKRYCWDVDAVGVIIEVESGYRYDAYINGSDRHIVTK